VQLVDVFATVLAAAGLPRPEFAGLAPHDLLAGTVPPDRPVIAEYAYPDQVLGFLPDGAADSAGVAPYLRDLRAVIVGDDKFVWGSDGRDELYDLAADPGERDNLVDRRPERAGELRTTLADLLQPWGGNVPTRPAEPRATDDSQLEALRSLGYVK
ncbi:MAG: hypothetical protein HKN12_09865, partial [Gemmatimonadetes bacterium]|nr:hypothetical protein [Gemmatimonadota bacterium]